MTQLKSFLVSLPLLFELSQTVPIDPLASTRTFTLGSSFGIPGNNVTFDYVVVGGGQAGLTIAARLAEQPSLRIAVIEAGTFYEISNGNVSQIPADDTTFAGKDPHDWQPAIDWGFVTDPQEALLDAKVHYPRGKCLGGSSARNYMTYHLSTKGAYERWANEVGDDSYLFENFLPYFQRSQNFTPPDMNRRFANATPQYNESALGTRGPLSVIYPNYAGAFGTWFVKGLAAIGIHSIPGFESGRLLGSAYALATINYDSNLRESSEVAFLQPSLQESEPNLIVYPSTMAKRILFNTQKKAVGVEVDTLGRKYTISASREVVLSAGAFQSPQLLMASGIGPAATLQEHGIDVLSDRPGVGQNMTDHVLFGTTYRVNVVTGSSLAYGSNEAIAEQQFREGYGILTNPNVDMFGWEKLPRGTSNNDSSSNSSSNFLSPSAIQDLSTFPADWPEIEYIGPAGYFGYSEDYQVGNPVDGYEYASAIAGLVAPLSRGNVTISSADTADAPIINPNWLSNPTDQAVAVAAFKRTRAIWRSDAMAELRIGDEYFPGTRAVPDDDDAAIWRFIQESFSTIFHAATTCRMGRVDDENAVVDSQARVIGVDGLRVVDASSMALLPPGHPMSTIYALAEKIAVDILTDGESV
ncbi:MAG: hypothetical protein M1822_001231 [Bathelium mastoideum]|nr:MAG: hypothetical protein M1822_001231 [Bathelium mastoideum]